MNETANRPGWATAAILVGRLVFAGLFLMAVSVKLAGPAGVAEQIAAAGFPLSGILIWCAIVLELALIAAFLTGAYFSEACLVAAAYVVFLGFGFHGPSHW